MCSPIIGVLGVELFHELLLSLRLFEGWICQMDAAFVHVLVRRGEPAVVGQAIIVLIFVLVIIFVLLFCALVRCPRLLDEVPVLGVEVIFQDLLRPLSVVSRKQRDELFFPLGRVPVRSHLPDHIGNLLVLRLFQRRSECNEMGIEYLPRQLAFEGRHLGRTTALLPHGELALHLLDHVLEEIHGLLAKRDVELGHEGTVIIGGAVVIGFVIDIEYESGIRSEGREIPLWVVLHESVIAEGLPRAVIKGARSAGGAL
mmetsp:Transcript_12384/g.34113  ORF Transcript_12384/g.34113 Transcript_12384/m.34113 type:complete len:257 (-) Transcript_12384:24-794(-)